MSPFLSYSSYGGGASGKLVSGSSGGATGWQILMMTDKVKTDSFWDQSSSESQNRMARMGNTEHLLGHLLLQVALVQILEQNMVMVMDYMMHSLINTAYQK